MRKRFLDTFLASPLSAFDIVSSGYDNFPSQYSPVKCPSTTFSILYQKTSTVTCKLRIGEYDPQSGAYRLEAEISIIDKVGDIKLCLAVLAHSGRGRVNLAKVTDETYSVPALIDGHLR